MGVGGALCLVLSLRAPSSFAQGYPKVPANIMDAAQALALAAEGSGVFVANHLEALDHCPTTRADLVAAAARVGLGHRLLVPADGQTLAFA